MLPLLIFLAATYTPPCALDENFHLDWHGPEPLPAGELSCCNVAAGILTMSVYDVFAADSINFEGCSSLRRLDLVRVAVVKKLALGSSLEEVHLDGVVVGKEGFYALPNLRQLTFGAGRTTLGDSSFKDSHKLEDVDFRGSGVTYVGREAFKGSQTLRAIYIGENMTQADYNAFSALPALEVLDLTAAPESFMLGGAGCSRPPPCYSRQHAAARWNPCSRSGELCADRPLV